jgi:hypothetical protein
VVLGEFRGRCDLARTALGTYGPGEFALHRINSDIVPRKRQHVFEFKI